MRLILGLIKGLVIGGAVGFGAFKLGMDGGWNWLTYAVVGAMVGFLVGRPIWSHLFDKESTVVVSVIKGIVGGVVGIGLYALVAKAWGGFDLELAALDAQPRNLYNWPFLLGGGIGALYGAFVEVDDAPGKKPEAAKPPTQE
ncbi:hypothetical protein [Haliangium sp.]|uniref:hypothetical protein n=1 Tax=Haliangium sp. TaxID=2663208 RepID=UPI003D0EF276